LVEAFEKVCKQIPDTKLVIAGVKSEAAYYEQLTKRIADSKYKDSIRLLIDLPQEELYQYYAKASIYALHSEEESQGIALVEAMAAGLPVVSTTVGGIPDVVTNEMTGLLSAYEDTDTFARNIIRLIQDSNMIAAMSVAAHEQAQEYIWDNIAAKIEKAY
jgi:glycosyltransferase involved in cell wall biosynthesis